MPAWYQQFPAVNSELYRVLADERRRTVLTVLCQSDTPTSESDIAQLVVDRKTANSKTAVATAHRDHVEISLHHLHLPRIEAAGLIERTDDGHIVCTEHPFWTDSDVRKFLTQDHAVPATTTATLDVLADDRRRAILTLLEDQQELTVEEIAEKLAETPLPVQELPNLTVELVHHHIPKLEDAGVVVVDSTGESVRYTGNVVLEAWFEELHP